MKILNNIDNDIKDKVIDWITSGVDGRIVVLKPEKNEFGADLLASKRGEHEKNKIYFKICSLVGPSNATKLSKDFLQENFKTNKNFYLIFVYFNSITQEIDDKLWLIPSVEFGNVSEVIKDQDGQKKIRFESFVNPYKKDKYSKFLIFTKDLGRLTLDAFSSGGKFKFKNIVFKERHPINLKLLEEFLIEARLNAFASGNSMVENPRLLGSSQFEFQKGDFFYRDIYFSGNKKTFGQEIVYENSTPIWAMNYVGGCLEIIEEGFLKEALLRLSTKCRLGKKCEFEKREYLYKDIGQGTIDNFSGREEIFVSQKNIYSLNYMGGLILDTL